MTTLMLYVIAAMASITPWVRASDGDAGKDFRATVVPRLKRNEVAIVTCEMRVARVLYEPDSAIKYDVSGLVARLSAADLRADPAAVDRVLRDAAKGWPGVEPVPPAHALIRYTKDSDKSRWEITNEAGELQIRAIYDGKLWLGDSGQQVTIRGQGSLVTENLGNYRYLPVALATRPPAEFRISRRGGDLVVHQDGAEQVFDEQGNYIRLTRDLPDGRKNRMHIFQYFHNKEASPLGVPTVRVDFGSDDERLIPSCVDP